MPVACEAVDNLDWLSMKRHLAFAITLAVSSLAGAAAAQTSWIFRPSYYSHDPGGYTRVEQFATHAPAYAPSDPTYRQSAYRQNRTSIRAGDSADNMHVVETWGAGESIRPYGEWLYPFRAGATPYGPWGNPQGPWTTPHQSWSNPYGLGQLPVPPWVHWYAPSHTPAPQPDPEVD